ncbi:hypothetical protein [Spirosoma endbachense]|uniref:Uncharacterized protein n=1 Tax=Spirosoma endbachense TaxID=2666025 RepID=A0A6P1VYB4_9BACT|nr:hypothetical protein [Spirosoma endbachense]QHV97298.1 hypothetical protein GJR95_20815 [Spirosoma endbachense]
MNNNELLDELTANVESILPRLKKPVVLYRQTMDGFNSCDVSSDLKYRKNFTRFYRLRLPRTDCYDHYFELLERSKTNLDISIAGILAELQTKTGRIEASFASKLLATINPHQPVIDSIVLNRMGLRLPGYSESNRMQKVIDLYQVLQARFEDMKQDERFSGLKLNFMTAFPDCGFTDLKILDLLIWQLRED